MIEFHTKKIAIVLFSSRCISLHRSLADVDTDGKLQAEEFSVAMYLADMVKMGQPLPMTLPANLIPPSMRSRSRSGSLQPPQPVGQSQPGLHVMLNQSQSDIYFLKGFYSVILNPVLTMQRKMIWLPSALTEVQNRWFLFRIVEKAGPVNYQPCESLSLIWHRLFHVFVVQRTDAAFGDLVPGGFGSAAAPQLVQEEQSIHPLSALSLEDKRRENFAKG